MPELDFERDAADIRVRDATLTTTASGRCRPDRGEASDIPSDYSLLEYIKILYLAPHFQLYLRGGTSPVRPLSHSRRLQPRYHCSHAPCADLVTCVDGSYAWSRRPVPVMRPERACTWQLSPERTLLPATTAATTSPDTSGLNFRHDPRPAAALLSLHSSSLPPSPRAPPAATASFHHTLACPRMRARVGPCMGGNGHRSSHIEALDAAGPHEAHAWQHGKVDPVPVQAPGESRRGCEHRRRLPCAQPLPLRRPRLPQGPPRRSVQAHRAREPGTCRHHRHRAPPPASAPTFPQLRHVHRGARARPPDAPPQRRHLRRRPPCTSAATAVRACADVALLLFRDLQSCFPGASAPRNVRLGG